MEEENRHLHNTVATLANFADDVEQARAMMTLNPEQGLKMLDQALTKLPKSPVSPIVSASPVSPVFSFDSTVSVNHQHVDWAVNAFPLRFSIQVNNEIGK